MPNKFHKDIEPGDIHGTTDKVYVTIAERDADIIWPVSANHQKEAKVVTPLSFYKLVNNGSATVSDSGGDALFTSVSHNLNVGDPVTGSGNTETSYNGNFIVTAVPSVDTYKVGLSYVSDDSGLFVVWFPIGSTGASNLAEILANGNTSGGTDLIVSSGDNLLVTDSMSVGGVTAPTTDTSIDLKDPAKAFLGNRGTTAERLALTPTEGMEYYDTDLNSKMYYNDVGWVAEGGGDVTGPSSAIDGELALFNTTTGKNIKGGSGVLGSEVIQDLQGVLATGNTSGGTNLIMSDGDKIGVQQPSPAAPLHVTGLSAVAEPTAIIDAPNAVSLRIKSAAGNPTYLEAQTGVTGLDAWKLGVRTSDAFEIGYDIAGVWVAEGFFHLNTSGQAGFGTILPGAKVEILDDGDQLKLSFDGTDNCIFGVDTNGVLTITPSGASVDFASKNLTSIGTATATTFSGDLNGTINTATTGATQSPLDNSTKVATTAYVDTAVTVEDHWDRVGTVLTPAADGDSLIVNDTAGSLEPGISVTATGDASILIDGNAGESYLEIANSVTATNGWKIGLNDTADLAFSYGVLGTMNVTAHAVITAAGNVGIGVAAPNSLLSVHEPTVTVGQILARFEANQDGGEWSGIGLGGFNEGTSKFGIINTRIANFGRGDLSFCLNYDADSSDFDLADAKLTIVGETGYVGIGIVTPTNPLEIRTLGLDSKVDPADRTSYALNLYQGDGSSGTGNGIAFVHNGSVQGSIMSTDRGGSNIGALDFYVDSGLDYSMAARMEWNTHFGIGVAPVANLHLLGATRTNTSGTIIATNGSLFISTSVDLTGHFNVGDAIRLSNTSPVETSVYTVDAITTNTITLDSVYSGTTDIDGTITAKKDADLVLFENGDGTDYFTIDKSGSLTVDTDTFFLDATTGKVGIGTTAPNQKLHIDVEGTSTYTGSPNFGIMITDGARPSLTFESVAEAANNRVMRLEYGSDEMSFGSLLDNGTYELEDILTIHRDGVVATDGHTVATIDDNVYEIWQESDFPNAAAGGKIVLDAGMYHFKATYSTANRFELAAGASVQFMMPNGYGNSLTYTGTDTFISSASGGTNSLRILFPGITIYLSGNGATLFDIDGSLGVAWAYFGFTGTSGTIGTLNGNDTGILTSQRFFWLNSSTDGWTTGLTVTNSNRLICDTGTITSHANASGAFLTMDNIQAFVNISKMVMNLENANASAFDIRPVNTNDIAITRIDLGDSVGSFFEEGSTGTFTAVADASIGSTNIFQVADTGGIASFNFTGVTVYAGQEVVISGFTINPDYNGTYIITSTNGTGFFLTGVAFGSNETGSFESNSVTLTDTTTTLVEGDQILMSDTDDYNKGSHVYNKLTNSVQVNATWVTTEAGTWGTGSLDETNKYVTVTNNGPQRDSGMSAEAYLENNALVTDIPAVDALVILNALTWTGELEELLRVKSDGGVRHDGIKAATLEVSADVSLDPATATKTLQAQLCGIHYPRTTVTFTNGTNIINETATPRADGDIISFHDNAGTLPAELRDDILYYVVSKATNTFQVSYTLGGSAIAFTDDGSGTNGYLTAGLHGSKSKLSISSGTPLSVSPKALIETSPSDEILIVISNKSDSVNITCDTGYVRSVGS